MGKEFTFVELEKISDAIGPAVRFYGDHHGRVDGRFAVDSLEQHGFLIIRKKDLPHGTQSHEAQR